MRKFVALCGNVIDRYGLMTFCIVLWLMIMFTFALLMYLLDYGGTIFSGLKDTIHYLLDFTLPLSTLISWVSWIAAGVAGLSIVYLLSQRLYLHRLSQDDPLFLPKTTLLMFVILFRLLWSVPSVKATIILMFYDGSGICQLILLIMFMGLTINFLQFLSLQNEYKGFLKTRSKLAARSPDNQDQLEPISQVMNESGGILNRKWRNLSQTLQNAIYTDYEILVSFPDEHELLKESKISFVIKILPLLGMVGTVLGFTLAVVGMESAASTMNDFASFKGNLLNALGGMKTAFLTTLTGMIAMIFVMWLNSLIEESRRHILLLETEFLFISLFLPWQKHQREKENSPTQDEASRRYVKI